MIPARRIYRSASPFAGLSTVEPMTNSIPDMIESDTYAELLGIRLESEDPVTVAMDVDERHLNFMGATHGGALFSLADCALSLVSNRPGAAVAIDAHLVLTGASRPGDTLTAVAEEVTRGRTLGSYRITVTRGDGRTVGLFTGTVAVVDQPEA